MRQHPSRLPSSCQRFVALAMLVAACGESKPPEAAPALTPDTETPAPPVVTPDTTEPRRPRPTPPPPILPEGWTSITRDAVTVGLSRDGAWLLAGDLGGHTAFWERKAGVFKWADLAKAGRIRHVICAETADRCWSSGFDGAEYPLRGYQLSPLESSGFLGNEGHDARGIAVKSDGSAVSAMITSVDGRHRVMTFATDSKRLVHEVDAGPHNGGHLAFIPGGSLLIRTLVSGGLEIHDTAGGAEPVIVHDDALKFESIAAATAEGGAVRIVGSVAHQLFHLQWISGEAPAIAKKVSVEDERFAVRALHRIDGGRLVAATRPTSGGLVFWDADTGKALAEVRTACPCEAHALAFDGKTAACKCADRSEIRHGPVALGGAELPGAGGDDTPSPTPETP